MFKTYQSCYVDLFARYKDCLKLGNMIIRHPRADPRPHNEKTYLRADLQPQENSVLQICASLPSMSGYHFPPLATFPETGGGSNHLVAARTPQARNPQEPSRPFLAPTRTPPPKKIILGPT